SSQSLRGVMPIASDAPSKPAFLRASGVRESHRDMNFMEFSSESPRRTSRMRVGRMPHCRNCPAIEGWAATCSLVSPRRRNTSSRLFLWLLEPFTEFFLLPLFARIRGITEKGRSPLAREVERGKVFGHSLKRDGNSFEDVEFSVIHCLSLDGLSCG